MQNFQALGAPPPDPQKPLATGGSALRPPKQPLNCEFLAMCCPRFALCIIVWGFVAFVLNNFFFSIQLQTLLCLLQMYA